jgi:hypothetical protein
MVFYDLAFFRGDHWDSGGGRDNRYLIKTERTDRGRRSGKRRTRRDGTDLIRTTKRGRKIGIKRTSRDEKGRRKKTKTGGRVWTRPTEKGQRSGIEKMRND